jgi:hypothetical protein
MMNQHSESNDLNNDYKETNVGTHQYIDTKNFDTDTDNKNKTEDYEKKPPNLEMALA